jgi:hypothetical protein
MCKLNSSIFDAGENVAPSPYNAEREEISNLIEKEPERQDTPALEGDKDREHIVVAGIGSALLGMMLFGPFFAVVLGCGAAYAAETNPKVRDRVGRAWAKTQEFNAEHHVLERGVNRIGKGVNWLAEKITGYSNDNSNENADSSPPTTTTVY